MTSSSIGKTNSRDQTWKFEGICREIEIKTGIPRIGGNKQIEFRIWGICRKNDGKSVETRKFMTDESKHDVTFNTLLRKKHIFVGSFPMNLYFNLKPLSIEMLD